jgi:type I restriction enzyme M protein
LFIDARKLGVPVDRTHRELTVDEIARIAGAYHVWRGEKGAGKYEDVPGFCKSAALDEIKQHGYVLTPGRYVGTEELAADEEPFDAKLRRLAARLGEQFSESTELENRIRTALKGVAGVI